MNYGIYNPNYGFPDSLSFGMKRLFAARPHPCYGSYLSLDPQTSKTRDIRLAVPLGIFLLKNTEKSSDQAELPALNTQNDFLEYELLVFFQSELVIHMENKLQTWFKSHEGADWAILYLRLFIGTIILLHNVGKMQAYNEIINYYPSWGIFGSAFIFVAIATIEVLCAISLMLGYKVRLSAAIMAASLLISLLFLFPGKGFGTSELLFVYLGIQVALVISGGGVYSLTPWLRPKERSLNEPATLPTNRRFNKKIIRIFAPTNLLKCNKYETETMASFTAVAWYVGCRIRTVVSSPQGIRRYVTRSERRPYAAPLLG